MRPTNSSTILLVSLLPLACIAPPLDPSEGDSEPGGTCVPGHQIVCGCPGGAIGAQACLPDGSGFGACECPGSSSVGSTTDASDADSACDESTGSSGSTDSSSEETTSPTPVCGDGNVDLGEACDDGNVEAGDGCDAECRLEGEHLVAGGLATGHAAIRYSVDGGASWQEGVLPEQLAGPVSDLELGTDAVLAIVARARIFRSTDDGATWTELALPITPREDNLSIHTTRFLDGRWFVGGRGQIAISDDDGLTWTLVHDDVTVQDQYGRPVAYNTFARIGDDLIAGSGLAGPYYTLRSSDGGDTWGNGLFSDGTNMPGSGADCATMRMIGEGGTFWAGASSICDGITYDAIDVWTNDSALSTAAWTPVTPNGISPRFWGIGGDGSGDVMVLWGDANYAVNRVLVYAVGDDPQLHPLPTASATVGYDKVRFTDGAFWIARGPVIGEEASILRSDDLGVTWSSIPEPGLDQVVSLAVR